MSYHNVRDKNGRFAKAGGNTNTPKKPRAKAVKIVPHILNAFLIDRSGSMSEWGKDKAVVNGFNEVLKGVREDAVKNKLTSYELINLFDTSIIDAGQVSELVYGRSGVRVGGNKLAYSGDGGGTCLWEFTAHIIKTIDTRLWALPAGTKVVLTVFTDGDENSSRGQWRIIGNIQKLIKEKQEAGWVINFIGAGNPVHVERAATDMGIYATNVASYQNDARGVNTVSAKFKAANSFYANTVSTGMSTTDGFFSNE